MVTVPLIVMCLYVIYLTVVVVAVAEENMVKNKLMLPYFFS